MTPRTAAATQPARLGAPWPRVLFIGSGEPWAGGAGHLVRQSLLLAALRPVAQVTCAMFHLPDRASRDPRAPDRVVPLPEPLPRPEGRVTRLLHNLTHPLPRGLRTLDPRPVRKAVARLEPRSFDAVLAYRVDFAWWAGVLDHPCLLLDVDDPEHVRRRRRSEARGEAIDLWTRLDLAKLRRFERRAVRRAREAFVCNRADQAAFAPEIPHILPNCVRVPAPRPPRQVAEPALLFLGNLAGGRSTPNGDALLWFLSEVYPRVRESVPSCRLLVAGKAAPWVADATRDRPGVEVLGFVDDLPGLMARVSASIAPIRFGTGTRIKILDAFAYGCPVVSTGIGCEGIEAQDGEHLLIADPPGAFADACSRLLREQDLQERLADAAYHQVRRLYDVAPQAARLAERIGATLQDCKQSGRT